MSFWDELQESAGDHITTGDVSMELFENIVRFGVMPLAVIQPTFYMGRCYILCFDYMDYVNKLLAAPDSRERVFQLLLYIRETAGTLGRCVRNAVGPIEEILSAIDDIVDERMHKLEAKVGESELEEAEEEAEAEEIEAEEMREDDEFASERQAMAEALNKKLKAVNISERIASELSGRLAAVYDCCVRYVHGLKELNAPDTCGEVVIFMHVFTNVQHIMDTQLRHLLLEDVFLEQTSPFRTGLMPWISHSVGELVHQMSEYGKQ